MTTAVTEPGVSKFDCDHIAYLSSFVSLTITYILIFVMLTVLVGLLIANGVRYYFEYFENLFARCLDHVRGGANRTASAVNRRDTRTSIMSGETAV